ncbi:MAG: helix-turn-helix transcriptional regulator [Acutalibacteraceae bacterium]|nr:helix-turn-helix transcriptional regulator [Acutalibacteraceae bacterium]
MYSTNLVKTDTLSHRGDYMFMPMLDSKIVGSVIAEFRKRKGISQEVLSGLSDIGRTHLSAIERGERKPTLETLYRICVALDVKMSELVIEIESRL